MGVVEEGSRREIATGVTHSSKQGTRVTLFNGRVWVMLGFVVAQAVFYL